MRGLEINYMGRGHPNINTYALRLFERMGQGADSLRTILCLIEDIQFKVFTTFHVYWPELGNFEVNSSQGSC